MNQKRFYGIAMPFITATALFIMIGISCTWGKQEYTTYWDFTGQHARRVYPEEEAKLDFERWATAGFFYIIACVGIVLHMREKRFPLALAERAGLFEALTKFKWVDITFDGRVTIYLSQRHASPLVDMIHDSILDKKQLAMKANYILGGPCTEIKLKCSLDEFKKISEAIASFQEKEVGKVDTSFFVSLKIATFQDVLHFLDAYPPEPGVAAKEDK